MSAASKETVLNLLIVQVKINYMIIPVVTKDLIFFSKLKSSCKQNYDLVQVKNEHDIETILIKCNYPICIMDIAFNLVDTIYFKEIFKNRGCHTIDTIAYYPHLDSALKEKAVKIGTKKQLTKNQLVKNVKKVIEELVFESIIEP